MDVRTTAEENISGLTDLAMAVRAAVEDKDPSRLGALFAPAALICVSGRFLAKEPMTIAGLEAAEATLELTQEQRAHCLLRLDAGGGSAPNLNWLLERGYAVLGKGCGAGAQCGIVHALDRVTIDVREGT